MAQLQFLNGSRDAEVQDLVEEASLTVGSDPDSHVLMKDELILAKHALIYSVGGQFYLKPESAQAKCGVNLRPIDPQGQAINDRDLILFGRTLAKFWRGTAPVGGGGGGDGASAADLARANKERDEAKAQVADLQKKLSAAQAASGSAAQAASALEAAKKEKDDVQKQLADVQKQLDAAKQSAKKDQEASQKKVEGLEKDKADLEKKHADAEAKLKAAEGERDQTKKKVEKLEGDLEKEKKRAEAAEADAAKAKPEIEKKEKELDAVRKSVEALRAQDAVAKRDRRAALREGSDVAKAIAALQVPDGVRDRIAAAIQDEIDREVLSRDGAVVPLRGLRCPGCDMDLEGEIGGLKLRRKHAQALRALGAQELSKDEVQALIAKVRAAAVKA